MAIGDKFFMADKETQDNINRNVGDIHSRVGTATDGNDGSGGTLMGKINTILFRLTAAWASKLDVDVSSRQSEAYASARYENLNANTMANHTPSATGNLSQKLAHIIQLLGGIGQKKLVSKQVAFDVSYPGTYYILDVSGGGQFEYAQTSLPYNADVLVIECDGLQHRFSGKTGTCIIGRFMSYPADNLTCVTSDAFNNVNYLVWQPFHFKDRLRIWVEKGSVSSGTLRAHYSLYE